MQPSKTLQHQGWGTWCPPHTEHAYFSWSAGQPGSVPPDSKLAQEALKAGEHILSSGGGVGGPPRGTSNVHYNYYGGRRPFRYGGFGGGGFGRRIFYFALGWGVADYYYSRHRRAERKAQESSSPPTDSRVQDAPQPRRFEWPSHCRREQVNTTPNTPPSSPSPVYQYAPAPLSAPISTTLDHRSELVKQLEQMKHSPAPKETTPIESKASVEHVWGWGARRRQRREAQAAEEKKAKELASPEADPDLMARLEETAKKFWEDKESVSAGLRNQAGQKRREVAREKLDKLSAALETLRESLGEEQDSRKARRV